MSDVWDEITDTIQEITKFQKLSIGMYVFEIVKVKKTVAVENDYSFASHRYKKTAEKVNGNKEEYKICDVDVRVWDWKKSTRHELQIKRGMLIHTQISWRIMVQIGRTVLKFKEYDLPVPKLLVYWKPNNLTVRYCFISEKMYYDYEQYFIDGNLEVLMRELYWLGKKEYKYNELEWVDWYKKEITEVNG